VLNFCAEETTAAAKKAQIVQATFNEMSFRATAFPLQTGAKLNQP
jgi:hypothetical protein